MKRWYVVQVYAGYEDQIKNDLQKRIKETNLEELFGEILIPSTRTKQFFRMGGGGELDEQLFPGYLLIEMESVPEAIRVVVTRPRVIRFLGGTEPAPLTMKEVERIQAQIRGEVVVPIKKHDMEIGKEVEIKEGPFAGFVGLVEKIDEENEKLTVMVSILGRMTPVELNFEQIRG